MEARGASGRAVSLYSVGSRLDSLRAGPRRSWLQGVSERNPKLSSHTFYSWILLLQTSSLSPFPHRIALSKAAFDPQWTPPSSALILLPCSSLPPPTHIHPTHTYPQTSNDSVLNTSAARRFPMSMAIPAASNPSTTASTASPCPRHIADAPGIQCTKGTGHLLARTRMTAHAK